MAENRVTKFEDALIDLIQMHMADGLTGDEVRLVLLARADDDHDAANHDDIVREIERRAKLTPRQREAEDEAK
jgi:hypothetical protein